LLLLLTHLPQAFDGSSCIHVAISSSVVSELACMATLLLGSTLIATKLDAARL
jgi:hypothetical protein